MSTLGIPKVTNFQLIFAHTIARQTSHQARRQLFFLQSPRQSPKCFTIVFETF